MTRDQLVGILEKLSHAPTLKDLPESSKQALQRLAQLTPSLIFNNKIADPQAWISRFLTGSGLFWENKVVRYLRGNRASSWKTIQANDLKGTLLFLLRTCQSEKSGKAALNEIIADIEQALYLIEEDQVLNLSSIREGMGSALPPHAWGDTDRASQRGLHLAGPSGAQASSWNAGPGVRDTHSRCGPQ